MEVKNSRRRTYNTDIVPNFKTSRFVIINKTLIDKKSLYTKSSLLLAKIYLLVFSEDLYLLSITLVLTTINARMDHGIKLLLLISKYTENTANK